MNLTGIIFAILSPATYATVNYFDKFFLEKYKINPTALSVYSGIVAIIVSIILIICFGLHTFPIIITAAIVVSGFFTELYLIPYFKALSLEDASTIVPLMQLFPFFVIIGDTLILREVLTLNQYIGGFLIIVSGLVISTEKISSRLFLPRKSFWYMVFANLSLALATLFFKYGVGEKDFWQILPYEGFGIFLCSVLILFFRKRYVVVINQTKKLKKRVFFLMFVNEGMYVLARYFGLFALSLISASLVSIFAGTQPLFALIYGVALSLWFPFLLKEVITKKTFTIKLFSIFIIIIGVILLSV